MHSKYLLAVGLACLSSLLSAQQAYFADGYHGGIYGHYPVEWQTDFMADLLDDHPEWRICLEIEPETWDTVRARTPLAYQRFRRKVEEGTQVEFTNPTYAQPYAYNISGESLVRQFQYGMKKLYYHFPGARLVTYSCEEPCFTSCLPGLLRQLGFKYAVLKCPDTCWGGYTTAYGGELLHWVGPDGTSLLTVPRYACEALEPHSTWQTTAWRNSTPYLDACREAGIKHPAGMCFQDAGWKNGPWLGSGKQIANDSRYTLWTDYIELISDGNEDDYWHVSQEDMHVNLMWGSQVLQRIARQVRDAENKLVQAEKVAAMLHWAEGYIPPQAKIDEAWRTLMLAQHHDSWIVPYNPLKGYGTWEQAVQHWTDHSIQTSEEICREALRLATTKEEGAEYLYVYNTQATDRKEVLAVPLPDELFRHGTSVRVSDAKGNTCPSDIVETAEGTLLHVEVEVPAFGYAAYRLISEAQRREASGSLRVGTDASYYTLENDRYILVFDLRHGGSISQLLDKQRGRHNLIPPGEAFNVLKGYFYEEGRFHTSLESPARLTVLTDNPLQKCVRIEGEIASHPFTQQISLRKGSPLIDCELMIHWKRNTGIGEYKETDWKADRRAFCDDRFKLRVLFPAALKSPRIAKDAPFDVCESRLDHTFFGSWSSIKHNVALHWVDLAETRKDGKGLALLTDHTTSYSYGGGEPLALTVQYSGQGLWGRDYALTQVSHVRYALMPHEGRWDSATVPTVSDCWNEPLLYALKSEGKAGRESFLDLPRQWQLSSVQVQDGSWVVRVFNASPEASSGRMNFGFPVDSVEEVDLRGHLMARLSLKGRQSVSLTLPAFGVKTFRVAWNKDKQIKV